MRPAAAAAAAATLSTTTTTVAAQTTTKATSIVCSIWAARFLHQISFIFTQKKRRKQNATQKQNQKKSNFKLVTRQPNLTNNNNNDDETDNSNNKHRKLFSRSSRSQIACGCSAVANCRCVGWRSECVWCKFNMHIEMYVCSMCIYFKKHFKHTTHFWVLWSRHCCC